MIYKWIKSHLPRPALPTATLYVGSPPWLFVLMSIVQSPSTYRLSLITEHFFAPRVRPLVKKPSRSFPTIISISTGCQRKKSRVSTTLSYRPISILKASCPWPRGLDRKLPLVPTRKYSSTHCFVIRSMHCAAVLPLEAVELLSRNPSWPKPCWVPRRP